MKDRTFLKILLITTAVGVLATLALLVFTILAYRGASIIAFIANERW